MTKLEQFVYERGLNLSTIRMMMITNNEFIIDFITEPTEFNNSNTMERVDGTVLTKRIESLIEVVDDEELMVEWLQFKMGV